MMRSTICSSKLWAVLASGPSLTASDIETVKNACINTIAVNSTIFAAPFADICFALDSQWWGCYQRKVEQLGCRMISSNPGCRDRGLEIVPQHSDPYAEGKASGKNSGHKAITLAILEGAKDIILLGFDCKPNGHHHAPHPDSLGRGATASSYAIWKRDFTALASANHGANIINCSRDSALECFPKLNLQFYLWARKQR